MRKGIISSLINKIVDIRHRVAFNAMLTIILVILGPLLVFLTFYAMQPIEGGRGSLRFVLIADFVYIIVVTTCLLYTSDAADE